MPEFINDQKRADYIGALLTSREFAVREGQPTTDVDAELSRLDAKPKAKRAEKRPAATAKETR